MPISVIIISTIHPDQFFFGRSENAIIYIRSSCDFFRTFCLIIQLIFNKRIISGMVEEFQNFERFFAVHFGYQLQYETLTKSIFVKLLLVMVGTLQYFCVFLLRAFVLKSANAPGILTKFSQGLAAATFLHIIFHIEILSFHLDQLNNVVQRDIQTRENEALGGLIIIGNSENFVQIKNNIKYMKTVYFRLWMQSKKINRYFGWCLVVIYLHGFIDTFYAAYWLYIQLQNNQCILRIIRK